MKSLYIFIAFMGISIFFSACKKDSFTGTGSLVIHLDHRAGASPLVFGQNYVTANGDTVNFTTFNYYVSNFVFMNEDGTEYTVPQDSCYFLVKHDEPESQELVFNNIPAGNYTGVEFIIGVDSAKSAAPLGERTGSLDPVTGAQGMYWMWNSGYIFVKVEGTSPQAPVDPMVGDRVFYYHIGGFGGYNTPTINNIKHAHLHAPEPNEPATVRENITPELHTYVDVLEIFTSPTTLDVAVNPAVMFDPYSTTISANYEDMFSIDHIHN